MWSTAVEPSAMANSSSRRLMGRLLQSTSILADPCGVRSSVTSTRASRLRWRHSLRRAWLPALDEKEGKLVGRAYNAGPDADVLISSQFKPFYSGDKGTDLGVTTWPTDAWKIGGSTAWGWVNYDAELNSIYYGSGNPGPWNAEQR